MDSPFDAFTLNLLKKEQEVFQTQLILSLSESKMNNWAVDK